MTPAAVHKIIGRRPVHTPWTVISDTMVLAAGLQGPEAACQSGD